MGMLYISSVTYLVLLLIHKNDCLSMSEGGTTTRSCSSGRFLTITSGTWSCNSVLGFCTGSSSATSRMNSQCGYGSSCTIKATNSWLTGDPCSGCGKTLYWSDSCPLLWSSWSSWSACPSDCITQSLHRSQSCQKPSGYSCGTAPSQSISCLLIGCTSSTEISRSTPNDLVYRSLTSNCFVAMKRTSFTFRARANNDLQLALGTHDCDDCGTHYEFIIGGWGNTKSAMYYGLSGTQCATYSQAILDQTFFDSFWISWEGNNIRTGKGGTVDSNVIMTCTRSTHFEANYILIRTGYGSSGEWRFPNDVACIHERNGNVDITADNTGCNAVSTYACASGYKQTAGNTQRTCGFGQIWSGYPLVCSDPTCKIDILFIIEASSHTSSIYSALVSAIGDLAGALQISANDIQAGVITFDDTVDKNIKFNAYSSASSLDSAITSLSISSASSSVDLAEALRVGFYEFFTLSNGNRYEAYRHFVLISKTHSQNGSVVANAIRQISKNQVFTIGIDPSSALITDLKAIAGDDSRYWEVSSPADLYPKFNEILQKIAVCPTTPLPDPVTVDCKLDITFIVESYNMRFSKTLLAGLMEDIPISSDGVRVGFVTYDSGATKEFGLTTYTSSETLRGAIENVPDRTSSDHFVYQGLIKARDSVFIGTDDREDANNHYVFVVGPFYSETAAVSREIRGSGNNFIFAAHVGSSFQSEYQECVDSCGDYTRYTNTDSYDNMMNIREQFIQKITSCEAIIEITQDCKIDLVFIMDDTDTISTSKFQEMKTFLVSLVTKIVVGDDAVRIGVVTYGDDAITVFNLNQYSTASAVKTAINGLTQGNAAYGRDRRIVEKALLHTLWNVFTKENGEREDAKNFYVVLTYGGSEGMQVSDYGAALQYNSMIELFILGANVTSSFDSDFEGAVTEGRYMSASNFIELQCNSKGLVSNITECPTEDPVPLATPSCKLDILFILEASSSSAGAKFVFLKSFFANLARKISVSSDTVRIGVITYDYKGYRQFDLKTHTTNDDVSNAIMKIPEGSVSKNLLDKALLYARTTYFTEANGDRADAANYFVFSVDGIRAGSAIQGAVINANWPNQVFAVDINSTYAQEYKDAAGDNSRYFFAPSYQNLSSIEAAVLKAISKCPSPQITTTTGVSLRNKAVTAPCLNSLIYMYPKDLTAYTGGSRGMMYLMTDYVFIITTCSRITSWEFSYSRSGWIDFMVWRPSGNNYKLVAYNTIYVEGVNSTIYTVVEYERIAVLENDVIGWRSLADNDGGNIITNGDCLDECAFGYQAYSAQTLQRGDEFDWKTSGTFINTTAYAIKACLEDNTIISFNNPNQSAEIPDHLPPGSFVMVLEVGGADYAENVTYTVMQHPSSNSSAEFFVVDEIAQVTLVKKMQRATVRKDYLFLVEAKDACNTSATVTLSIESQNMPPEILDLPNSMSVAEETGGETVLYSTIVEDPSGDEICCLLETVLPSSTNFNVTGNSTAGSSRGIFSILTTANPAFSYKDINSYMVKLCCDDSADKTTGILLVNVKKPGKDAGYEPPNWFMLSVAMSCIPVFVMGFCSCFVLILTMFLV